MGASGGAGGIPRPVGGGTVPVGEGGGGGGGDSGIVVNPDGTLNIPGVGDAVPPGSPEALAVLKNLPPDECAKILNDPKVKRALTAQGEKLGEILGMLHMRVAGDTIVYDDHYTDGSHEAAQAKATGSVDNGGFSPEEEAVAKAFRKLGVQVPTTPAGLQALAKQYKDNPQFKELVQRFSHAMANPTPQNVSGFTAYMMDVAAKNPHGNVMELLFLVMRESIKDMNEDKKYYLQKLETYNKMAEQLASDLSECVDASTDLSERGASSKYPEMNLTSEPVNVRRYDFEALGPDGKLVETGNSYSKRVTSTGLNDIIKDLEAQQETLRNKRQMATTGFQNFDQKTNQLYNMLASVLKTMNEMRGIGAGSRSGL